jgi:hypothetical protein
VARIRRDAHAEADDVYWADLIAGTPKAINQLKAARKRARARGYGYRTVSDLADNASVEEIVDRVETLISRGETRRDAKALRGTINLPAVPISEAIDVYVNEIAGSRQVAQSASQLGEGEATCDQQLHSRSR